MSRRRGLAAVVASSLLAVTIGSAVGASSASAEVGASAPAFDTPCFASPKVQQTGTYTVPATGVSTVRAELRGQNGGHGGIGVNPEPVGGQGSTLVVELPVAPGQVLQFGRLVGAPGGTAPGTIAVGTSFSTGYAGGKGGDAQYVSTVGSDGCQHALAVAGGGGGGSGYRGAGGNAQAGSPATAGTNGGSNRQVDGGGGGGATATEGGSPGAKGYNPLGGCPDGNNGRWGVFLNDGDGGNAAPVQRTAYCDYPSHGGGGGGAGYWYGGGGGSPYSEGSPITSTGVTNAAGGGGGGSSYIHPSVTQLSLSSGAQALDPVVVPVFDTVVTVVSSPNPSVEGKPVTVTARVTVAGSGRPVLGGTVTATTSNWGAVLEPVGTNGEFAVTTTTLPVGVQVFVVSFLATTLPTEAYRSSTNLDTLTGHQVHPCAPAPQFMEQPVDLSVTAGTSAVFSAVVAVYPVYEGTPTVQWQTSTDGGATWTNAPGTGSVDVAFGRGLATLSSDPSFAPGQVRYRAIATTCGGTVTSTPATLTIKGIVFSLGSLPPTTFGAAPFDISSYASGSTVPVGFTSDTPAVCAVSGSTVTVTGAGTCSVTASQSDASATPRAPDVQQSFDTAKRAVTVAASSPPSQPQGTATAPVITCATTGFLGADTYVTPPTSGLYGRIWDGETFRLRSVSYSSRLPQGTYYTQCLGGDPGSNYLIGSRSAGTFRITAPVPTLTITATSTRSTYGTTPPVLDVSYSGSTSGLVGTLTCRAYARSDTAYASPITLSDTTAVVAGGYAIHCGGLTSSTHTLNWVDGTLTVDPAPVAVTASSPADQTHGAMSWPSITCTATGFLGQDGFVTDPVGAVYDATGTNQVPTGSPLDVGHYTTKCSGGDPGGNYTISGYAAGAFTVKDTTAPVVAVPGNMTVEATGPAGAVAAYETSASDAVDGPLTATCEPSSGTMFAVGTTTVTCSATDASGNTGSASFTVTVKDATSQLTDLQTEVQRLVDQRTSKSLLTILQSARTALGKGDVLAACDKLTSFANQVQALSGKKIPGSTADGLLDDARRILAVLDCP